jgi:hypothetical protein
VKREHDKYVERKKAVRDGENENDLDQEKRQRKRFQQPFPHVTL